MLSKLTLVGLNNFSDGHLWDNLNLPEGYDKEIIVAEILRQGGEFPVLYPDLDYLKYMIGIWSRKFYHNFERWYEAFCFEYEALYNLDVKSTITENAKDVDNDLRYRLANRNGLSGQKEDSKNWEINQVQNQAVNQAGKAAYDADNFKPITSESTSSSTSNSTSNSTFLSTSEGHSESESSSESNSHSYEHSQTIEEWRRGNQGVTQSQELLLSEYNAWRANIYEMIGELFVSEFCICIYQ